MLVVLLALLFLASPQIALAQTANTITVVPSIVRLDLATDKPEATLSYKNGTDQTIELSLSASDVTELEDGYKLSFLEQKNPENYKYTLSSWIDFDKKTLVIEPFQTTSVTVFVNKEHLTPGGHYGAVLARVVNQSDTKDVAIEGVLSSLLFVRTNTGQEREEARVERFAVMTDWFEFPKSALLRLHNTGNTDVTPYGLVEVRDMFGRLVAKGIVNENSSMTLPESIRRYDVPLTQQVNVLFPGMYKATLTGHFGKNHTFSTATSFFAQGSTLLIASGLFPFIFLFFLRKRLRKKKH